MGYRHIQLDRRGLGPFVRQWQHSLTQQIAESPFRHSANAGLILREHVLSARPDALGLSIDFSSSVVWLALVEVANPHDVETLILSDSQTALVSAVTGKATVPVPNAEIAATTRALLHSAASALDTVPLVTATPLPIE